MHLLLKIEEFVAKLAFRKEDEAVRGAGCVRALMRTSRAPPTENNLPFHPSKVFQTMSLRFWNTINFFFWALCEGKTQITSSRTLNLDLKSLTNSCHHGFMGNFTSHENKFIKVNCFPRSKLEHNDVGSFEWPNNQVRKP